MNIAARLDAMVQLGNHLKGKDEYLQALMQRTYQKNQWFTIENQEKAIQAIVTAFLNEDALNNWVEKYDLKEISESKTIGLVMAGNIPLVGFHDLLCVFVAGHYAQVKLSEKDPYLLPYLIKILTQINPETASYFSLVDKLHNFDAVIATGSNNTARYFEAYFGKYPHIIRKNRNAVAVLDGKEDDDELKTLGNDVFQYFGLGCRNVSKIYVPEGYDFTALLEALHEYRNIVLHSKYKNNFDYNYALYIINRERYMANGCIMLLEKEAITSRIANLHYEYYKDKEELIKKLKTKLEEIQLVVSHMSLSEIETVPFGEAQQPSLSDYADGVDTMQFLVDL